MADIAAGSFKLFSASDDHLLAECDRCGRVLKVPRLRVKEVAGGFEVADGVLCPCGQQARRIDSPPEKPRPLEKKPSLLETIFAQGMVWGVVGGILVGVGYVLFSIFGAAADMGGGDSEPIPDLRASVEVAGGQVHVTNDDPFDWTRCTITLNAGFGGSWSQEVGRIPASQTVSGGLMAFTRGRGERFNPLTHAVEDILLDCYTPAGRSTWAGRF